MTEDKKEGSVVLPPGPGTPQNKSVGTGQAVTGTQAAAEKAEKGSAGLEGPWMYVGPTIPGIGIQNRVYTEMPKGVQEQAKKMPEIGLLFIPVKDYPMANQMLREGTGYIYQAYCKVGQAMRGGDGS